eukprot:CAMPEP_0170852510 /NCGR_PEP_ID=MMETSP0734-20130129/11924_1 /TAXON_ID=186038 /ORGANISM="Fragilariopsis kerguelensis, Strain L26-C5" /LENGTH=140 /DNA_ID=CAMNT_0011222939 /DNA_START=45 /DNA_END=467 /DNA_ORIENTATION=+
MKYIIALIIAAVIATYPKSTDAFGVSTTRKTFLSKVEVPALICTTTTTMIVALPNNASAADGVLQNAEKKAAEKKARRDKAAAVAAREKASNDEDTATNKAGSNESFRGGKTAADKIIYGTELNERQTEETNGLMGKLGL